MKITQKFLSFTVGNESFAVPLLKVREVIGMPDVTGIPQPPTHVVGIFNLRGQIITIFDLRSRLSSSKKNDQPTVIICEMPFGQMGMIVDTVSSVLSVESDQLSEVPPGSRAANHDFITNIYSKETELILMLDVDKVIGRDVKIAQVAATSAA